MMDKKQIWQAVLGEIEVTISKSHFVTWFSNTYIASIEDGQVVIAVPHGFSKEWLENKYDKFIRESLAKHCGEITSIEYRVASQERGCSDGMGSVKQENRMPSLATLPTGVFGLYETNLNSRYTFDNHIIGSHNELARAACESVAEDPGNKYNPLFIYGGVGLGKTHLLQAIGNHVLRQERGDRVKYVTSEKFTTELVDSIRRQNIDLFKKTYREIDILLIDDIQFVGGKEKTQEELFHLFNALYQQNKQIVFCSDRPPRSIATLEERLRSRFEGGMIVDIVRPDLETKVAILSEKCRMLNFPASYEALEYIAQNIQSNVRELEGALNRFIATCQLKKISPNLESAITVLDPHFQKTPVDVLTPKKIIEAVSSYYNIPAEEIIGKGRRGNVVRPRQMAVFLIRTATRMSYPCIGKELGGRDHTTIMHAFKKAEEEMERNDMFEQEILSIKERFLL